MTNKTGKTMRGFKCYRDEEVFSELYKEGKFGDLNVRMMKQNNEADFDTDED